jgi:hypothetical protein
MRNVLAELRKLADKRRVLIDQLKDDGWDSEGVEPEGLPSE